MLVMKAKKAKKYPKKDLKIFKELLLKLKTRLLEQILAVEKDALDKSQKDASGDLSGYSIHMADVATDSYDREFSFSRASVEQKVIYEIDEALKRIEDGEYGICLECGGQISKKRLKALPYVKFCITCQNAEEKNKK
jgi:RNA polymerase-binding protein DksA